MFSPQMLDHFRNPRNVGDLPQADASVQVENPACGDVMQLMLRVREGRIEDARFRTRGCVASIACGSLLTEMLRGRTLGEARALQREELVREVGGLSNESLHASHLAMDALKAALKQVGAKA
jgi:nitrogen fixation protein NifU and related proteins